jgi:aldehyde dehydrogenase (NAD+)
LALRTKNGGDRIAVALADDDDNLALAVLMASEAAVDAGLFEVGGLHVAAKIAAINLSLFAFSADDAAFHFLCHGFTQLVQEDEGGLVGQAQVAGHKGMIYREPYGVALIIGPFNGPLLLLVRPALAALAAGNTCILTLSEALPATTEVLLDLVPKYFDPAAVTAVPGGKETNTELLKLPNDFIFFTGSTFVGKIIARAAAETLTHAGPARTWRDEPRRRGRDRQHPVADAFVAEAKKALIELFGNDPKSNSDYSRIINARTVDRLAGLIDPSKVIAGGKSDRDAHYLDPTLLYPITWDDKIMEDEIFGPILPILTYKSFDEAMMRMAKTGRPLAGFIFSRDQRTIDRFIGQLSFGGGGVNLVNVHLFVETMPFGGTGSAGIGH